MISNRFSVAIHLDNAPLITGLGVGPGVGTLIPCIVGNSDVTDPSNVGTGDIGPDTGLGVGFSDGDALLVGAVDVKTPEEVGDTPFDPAVGLGVGFSLGDALLVGAGDVTALLEIINNIVNMKEYIVPIRGYII